MNSKTDEIKQVVEDIESAIMLMKRINDKYFGKKTYRIGKVFKRRRGNEEIKYLPPYTTEFTGYPANTIYHFRP